MLGEKPLHSGEHATSHTAAGWLRRTVQPLQNGGRFEDKWEFINQSADLFRAGGGFEDKWKFISQSTDLFRGGGGVDPL